MSDPEDAPASVDLRRTALHDRHLAAGGRLVPFAGWAMPVQYASGILAEHEAVRTRAGVFDVSHMGRVWVDGPGAGARIRSVTTYNVTRLAPGQAHYSLYCNEDGGIDDDIFVYRATDERWLLVHNAANGQADLERLASAAPQAREVTADTVMLAVQGPTSMEIAASILGEEVPRMVPRTCALVSWRGNEVLIGRTGYTGEDGIECVLDAEAGLALWDALLSAGVTPAGLGARDTLRLEAALPLHGNDIDPTTAPFEARLGWAVSLDDTAPFTGRAALEVLRDDPPARRLSCLRLEGRGVPRHGYLVFDGDGPEAARVTVLTSGAFSPTLRVGIAMAYLPVALAKPGTVVFVDLRGRLTPAVVVPRPFYRRPA